MIREQVQEEGLIEALKHQCCGLEITQRTGKTRIGLQYIQAISNELGNIKALIVIPKLSVKDSWINEAAEISFDISVLEFTTYISLCKHDPRRYAVIILDEAQSTKENYEVFLGAAKMNNKRILGLSGTPPKGSWGEKAYMRNNYYPIVYVFTREEAIKEEILNDYRIYLHYTTLSQTRDLPKKGKNGNFYVSEQSNYDWITQQIGLAEGQRKQFLSIQRMNMIKQHKGKELLAKKLFDSRTNPCLIFATTQQQADYFSSYSFHSKNKNSKENLEKFKTGEITKLSAVEQLSEGITIKGLKEVIIVHAFGNNRRFSQKMSRTLNLVIGEIAIIHLIIVKDTADERWALEALAEIPEEKIIGKL